MSILMVNHEATFNELKETLGVTYGNLASHLKALESKDYIVVRKEFVNRKPLTTYSINNEGRLAFKNHIDALERLLK